MARFRIYLDRADLTLIQPALNDLTLPNQLKNRLNRWITNFNIMMATWDSNPPPDAPQEYQSAQNDVKMFEINHNQMNINELRNQLLDVRNFKPGVAAYEHCHAIFKHLRFGNFDNL